MRGMHVGRMGWRGRGGVVDGEVGGGVVGASAAPLGLIVEARLNGAGAGKVSAQ